MAQSHAKLIGNSEKMNIGTFIGNINTPSLKSTGVLFNGCTNLKSVDLSHFDFSQVTEMEYIFFQLS